MQSGAESMYGKGRRSTLLRPDRILLLSPALFAPFPANFSPSIKFFPQTLLFPASCGPENRFTARCSSVFFDKAALTAFPFPVPVSAYSQQFALAAGFRDIFKINSLFTVCRRSAEQFPEKFDGSEIPHGLFPPVSFVMLCILYIYRLILSIFRRL